MQRTIVETVIRNGPCSGDSGDSETGESPSSFDSGDNEAIVPNIVPEIVFNVQPVETETKAFPGEPYSGDSGDSEPGESPDSNFGTPPYTPDEPRMPPKLKCCACDHVYTKFCGENAGWTRRKTTNIKRHPITDGNKKAPKKQRTE